MNINFLIPHLKVAGGIRVTLTYANWLSDFGHEVHISVFGQRSFLEKALTYTQLKPHWMPIKGAVRYASKVDNTILQSDVVIADSWQLAAKILPHQHEVQVFHLIQHDERLYHGQVRDVSDVYTSDLRKIVVSSWLKEMLQKDFSQSSELLLNSFDKNLFHPVSREHVHSDDFRILLLNHSYEWKGTGEALRILTNLKKQYSQIKIIGFGARHSQFDTLFDEYHHQVPQKKLADLYSSADVFVCSSWDEGFGLPSLEAMACGVPVVTYDNGGSRDFAFHGKTALVAPRKDVTTLQTHIVTLMENPELRSTLKDNGLRLTHVWPTWEDQAQKLEKILCQK